MADDLIYIDIITPENTVVSEEVESFEATGVDGEFQIYAGHTPFLTNLRIGHVILHKSGQQTNISISFGFCEVKEKRAVILAHTAEKASEIDNERANAAKKRAEQRLESKDESINMERAHLALLRAINRIKVSEM